jgi:spore maturation protein CgeB
MLEFDFAVVGPAGNTHISASFMRAAHELGLRARSFDTSSAYIGPRLLRSVVWRLGGHRPYRLKLFSQIVTKKIIKQPAKFLIILGQAPILPCDLVKIKNTGIRCLHFSTDDPFNTAHFAKWQVRTLPIYDILFTPRKSNIDDFINLGCKSVVYLPFGYDGKLFGARNHADLAHQNDVLFVGGADRDRAEFFAKYIITGPRPTLVGSYWERYPQVRAHSIGPKSSEVLEELTARSAVNLVLVRKANRDGHTMRSFEAGAIGGCLLVEDTVEHREIFGEDGVNVRFFSSPEHAAWVARELLADPLQRTRLAENVCRHIRGGRNAYAERLRFMLEVAGVGEV